MPINLTPFKHDTLCHGHTWVVSDENLLAQQVARVALGQSRHVQKILAGASLADPPTSASAAAEAIKLLTVAPGSDPSHRDGWMFQVMSWIAAHRAKAGAIIRAPHMILADKGFDGLELELESETGVVIAAIIFEDKATGNPRETIKRDVWPEFEALNAGGRENLLIAEVTALLTTQPGVDVELAIHNVIWNSVRHYRISITVGDSHQRPKAHSRLFKGYDSVVPGKDERRRGETFYVCNLRPWMQSLADKAIEAIRNEVGANV